MIVAPLYEEQKAMAFRFGSFFTSVKNACMESISGKKAILTRKQFKGPPVYNPSSSFG